MPQRILDNLKQLAMRNVPQRPATQGEQENNDLRAKAIQDEQPLSSGKSVGRNLFDLVTNGIAGDPFQDGSDKLSWGSKAGMLGAALPMIPKLPIIAPEAYNDVKAGGLRLYSRLTDAFAKAPKQLVPGKIRSIAQQGASAEEFSLRKLEDFLKGKPEMAKIPREDIMSHLASNPLELDVVRKGNGVKSAEEDAAAKYLHDMDTRYGTGWQWEPTADTMDEARIRPSLAEREQYEHLQRLADESTNTDDLIERGARYDWLQTPGPKENYGESLINYPNPDRVRLMGERATTGGRQVAIQKEAGGVPVNGPLTPEYEQLDQLRHAQDKQIDDLTFQTSHFPDDPNNIVWSRHNDRFLENPQFKGGLSGETDHPDAVTAYKDWGEPTTGKGRFIEEIQSDWHQQGREHGYKGDPYPEMITEQTGATHPGEAYFSRLASEGNYNPNIHYGDTPERAEELVKRNVDATRVPQAPFKDTYHELALKQQLLDAANDPSLEWLGVADADTAMKMEGHIEQLGQAKGRRPGMDLYYNDKHPSALEKLLKPLGGKTEYANLPSDEVVSSSPSISMGSFENPAKTAGIVRGTKGSPAATILRDGIKPTPNMADEFKVAQQVSGHHVPGEGMWKANLTPELKQLIKERGFPAMAALVALQQSMKKDQQ